MSIDIEYKLSKKGIGSMPYNFLEDDLRAAGIKWLINWRFTKKKTSNC